MASQMSRFKLAQSLSEILSPVQRRALVPQLVDCFHDHSEWEGDDFLLSLFTQICHCEDVSDIIHYVEGLITDSTSAAPALKCAANLCSRIPSLQPGISSKILETLGIFLSHQRKAQDWIRQVLRDVRELGLVKDLRTATGNLPIGQEVSAANAQRCLRFLKISLSSKNNELYLISPTVLLYSLALLDSDTGIVAAAAQEAVFVLLSFIGETRINLALSPKPDSSAITPSQISHLIWHRVKVLISNKADAPTKQLGLQLRLRWTALPQPWGPPEEILGQDDYWSSLQEGLRTGYHEQRKTCLYTLRLSMPLLAHDLALDHMCFSASNRSELLMQYERYYAVYEILVITRYINQAQDCLRDLDFFVSSQCLIHRSWLYVLVQAAMGPTMQNSIRNFCGRWFTNLTHWPDQGCDDLIHLLGASYLPWATQGHLYNSSIVTQDHTCICNHGNSIANFLSRLLTNFYEAGSAINFQDVVKAGLKFMASRDHNLFAYAGAYMFLGLACGLRGTSLPLTYEDRQAILKLASRSNITEIARDFYRASCHSILQNTSISDATHEPKEEIFHLFNERKRSVHPKIHSDAGWPGCWPVWKNLALEESIKTHTSFEEFPAFLLPGVENLASILLASRYNCLRGDGLIIACDYLEDSMLDLSCKPLLADLYMILEAIWNEVEVQDFPKHILLRLPLLFLHRTCLTTLADEHLDTHDLSELICKVIFELQRLAENRIYVLSPLSKALRLAMLCDGRFAKSFPFGQFLVNFCNRPPLPKAEFLLEAATIPLFAQLAGFNQERRYEDYYGYREGYGYACIYDLVNRVSLDPSSARFVFDQLLKPWIHQKDDKLVVNKQKTTLQLQMVLLLVDQVIESASPEHSNEAKHHFDKLMSMLPAEPLPRYRFLIECIMLRIIAKERGLRNELLYILKNCDQSKPKYVVSLIKMAIMAARLETSTGNYVREVMIILVTMVASPKIMIRHEAQWSFPFLWDHAETHGLTEVTENPAFAALNEYIRSLEKYMTPPAGRKLEPLDPVRDMTICNIVQGPFLQLYPPEKERAQAADFELIFADKVQMDDVSAARIPLGKLRTDINVSIDHTLLDSQVEVSERTELEGEASGDQKQMPIQTKGAAWQANALDSISALQDSASDVRAPTILMASLIQSPHNLGGLSRVAEAFGVAALYVASLTVLTNKEFLATSVSSEQHLNIQETPLKTNKGHASKAPSDLEGLAETLMNLKGDGYKIIGIEQTDQSFLLGSEEAAKLLMDTSEASPDKPDDVKDYNGDQQGKAIGKIAFVLGSEKEGIPAWIMKECDACIEIPQVGVTRSLNVQTAAATVLYEYTRLSRLDKRAV